MDYKILDIESIVMWHEIFKGSGKRVSVLIVCLLLFCFCMRVVLQMSTCRQSAVE